MDGVLGKPVSLAELLDVIRTHVWSAPPAGTRFDLHETFPVVAKPNGFVPVLSVARLGELRDNLPPEKFAELLQECLTDMDHRLPALRQALRAGTPGAIIAHAHALTGMAGGYGMDALEDRLRTILAAATMADMTPLGSSLIAELDADFAEAARQLRELLHSEGG
jgi:HPt (histidine-containing phosphotransfer) domain-containing protein